MEECVLEASHVNLQRWRDKRDNHTELGGTLVTNGFSFLLV